MKKKGKKAPGKPAPAPKKRGKSLVMEIVEAAKAKVDAIEAFQPKKRGWPKGKKRGKKSGLPKKGTPERAAVERTAKKMVADANGWLPTPPKLPASAGWRKRGKGPSPRFYRKRPGKPLLKSQVLDRNEIRRLQAENQALKELLGRYLVEKALSVKARGEYLAGLDKA